MIQKGYIIFQNGLITNWNINKYLVINIFFPTGYFLKCSTDLMVELVKVTLKRVQIEQ